MENTSRKMPLSAQLAAVSDRLHQHNLINQRQEAIRQIRADRDSRSASIDLNVLPRDPGIAISQGTTEQESRSTGTQLNNAYDKHNLASPSHVPLPPPTRDGDGTSSIHQADKTGDESGLGRQDQGQSSASASKPKGLRRRIMTVLVALSAVILAVIIFCAVTFGTRANLPTSSGPTVTLSYGQYQGVSLQNGITQYLGMRYAAPVRRFDAPQPPQSFTGVHIAESIMPGCRGSGVFTDDTEDCLFADIYAPTGANATSKLPVYVFIQGGGLTNAMGHMNGTDFLRAAHNGLVIVSFSYRAGVFGFLASPEIQKGGALNAGYLDQYQLLKWVQKEISQFGGDPGHVVIGGQSAGAGSVVTQLTAYGGVDKGLFHGALMQSQSMPAIRNITDQQFQYDNLVRRTGCEGKTDTLACLRSKSGQEILDAAVPAPYPGAGGAPVFQWAPVIDGDFLRDLPVAAIGNGHFIKVPTIFGDDTDEGTIFTPQSVKTEESARTFIKNNWPTVTSGQLDRYSSMYDFEDTESDSPYWHKAASAYGETRYICPGIHMSNLVTAQPGMSRKVWNWRYNVVTEGQLARGNGVSHGSELMAVFGPPEGGSGQQYELLTSEDGINNVVNHVQGYWTSFVLTLDPNTKKSSTAPRWDTWTGKNRVLFNLNGTTMEEIDSGQLDRCGYLAQITLSLQQ